MTAVDLSRPVLIQGRHASVLRLGTLRNLHYVRGR